MSSLLSVADARAKILARCRTPPGVIEPLTPHLAGRVLAEPVSADRDSPPFDKALMDGYAVRSADFGDGPTRLRVVGEVAAGVAPVSPVRPGEAIRVMTGAPLPAGADAVVMHERTVAEAVDLVRIDGPNPRPGQNVLRRGAEMRAGEEVLTIGTVLRSSVFGLLAALGRSEVSVRPSPRVAILATGDELVDIRQTPGYGQIRNSNGPMLLSQAASAGAVTRDLGIARDDPTALAATVSEAMAGSDVVILSGGVSAGSYDFVPGVLADLGVETHFHKIAMKPGKPLLFGTRGDILVFGLPGNPVSSFVCFELFVRPALRVLNGRPDPVPEPEMTPLADSLKNRSDRPTFHPAWLEIMDGERRVRPVGWLGSADLRSLTRSNALIVLPEGEVDLRAGERVPVMAID